MSHATKYRLGKLARLVAVELAHYYAEQAKVFEQYGTERKTVTAAERARYGLTLREIAVEHATEAQRRLEELAAVEVTIDWGPVRSCDLPSATVADYLDLGPLCELVEPPDA